MIWNNMMMAGVANGPVIASFSQSSIYSGLSAASVANMSDGLFAPFTATGAELVPFVRAHLAAPAFVNNVVLGPSTSDGGWGASYLNGAQLETSNNGGVNWSSVATLSGFATATSASVGTMQSYAIGAVVTDIRVKRQTGSSDYVALSEFKVN